MREKQPATDRQREFATERGIFLPLDCDIREASRLIGLGLYGPAHPVYVAIARHYGVDVEIERSRNDLLGELMGRLRTPGREVDLAEWYIYRVYRHIVGHRQDVGTIYPWDSRFGAAVQLILAHPSLIDALLSAANTSNFLRFGDDEDASTRTKLFRSVRSSVEHLKPVEAKKPAVGAVKKSNNKSVGDRRSREPRTDFLNKNRGCGTLIVIGAVALLVYSCWSQVRASSGPLPALVVPSMEHYE